MTDAAYMLETNDAATAPIRAGQEELRIDIVFPRLPPALDGIGDHTARFAQALASHAQVRILTAQRDADPVPGADVVQAYTLDHPRGIRALVDTVRADPPDWLFLQFNQFSYGRWGFNPYLPLAIRAVKRAVPTIRVAFMAHEDFVPPRSWKMAIMRLWQRRQFRALGRHADVVFFSIDPWVRRYTSWFPGTPVHHLPVGSNIPYLGLERRSARQRIGLSEDTFVAGVFGTLNASRMLSLIRDAGAALARRADDVTLLYVGPDGSALRRTMAGLPVVDAGRLGPEEVSAHLSAMDLYLMPFSSGVSTRRGSLMAGLQHGIATVGTTGDLTDDILANADGQAFVLAPTGDRDAFIRHVIELYDAPEERARLGAAARTFYQSHFTFDRAASRFLEGARAYDAALAPSRACATSPNATYRTPA